MASAARSFTRAAARSSTPATSSLRLAGSNARFAIPRQAFQHSRRGYASGPEGKSSSSLLWGAAGLAGIGGAAGYYFLNGGTLKESSAAEGPRGIFTPTQEDYQKVYDRIAKELVEKDEYDDGSYGELGGNTAGLIIGSSC